MPEEQERSEHSEVESISHQEAAEYLDIDERYTPVPEVDATGHLGKVSDPFIEMKYPLNRDNGLDEGVIDGASRWQAVQRPDGSGVVRSSSGGVLYGIRLADGTIIGNEGTNFWFPYHSEYHQRRPDDSGEVDVYDYDWFIQFPFRFVGEVLTEFTDLDMASEDSMLRLGSGEDTFVEGPDFMRGVIGADLLEDDDERGVLLEHKNGVQVYVGWDSTAWDDYEMFGFVPFDGENGVRAPSAEDALDLLRPNEAAAASDSRVERQGEWFLIPTDDEPGGTIQTPGVSSKEWRYVVPGVGTFETRHEAIGEAATVQHPLALESVRAEREYPCGSPLDNHIPRDWKTAVDDDTFVGRFFKYKGGHSGFDAHSTPQDVVDYIFEREDQYDDEMEVYDDIREMAEGIYVRGTLRHRDNEHEMSRAEEWRKATTHDWDVMTQDGQTYHME